jgi:hypothetical protein
MKLIINIIAITFMTVLPPIVSLFMYFLTVFL